MGLLGGAIKWSLDSLYVSTETRVLRFRPWPDPGVWAGISTTHCTVPLDARIGLADFEAEREHRVHYEARALDCFFARIPAPIRDLVSPFPDGLFHVLHLLHSSEASTTELIESNRGLAFAVAVSAQLKTEPGLVGWRTPIELVSMKRKEIVDWLEFPGGKSTVKIFERLTRHALFARHLRTLRTLLQDEDPTVRKSLQHLGRLTPDVLAILVSPRLRRLTTMRFLAAASQMNTFAAFTAQRLEKALDAFTRLHPERTLSGFDSLEALDEFVMDQGLELELDHALETQARLKFPEPPVPGNGNITPLDDAKKLATESAEQGNCARNYFRWVRAGEYYLYRMELPERCTIALGRGRRGWELTEIKVARNMQPTKEATLRVVQRWLKDNRRVVRSIAL